jgi:hypothetical protein
METPDRPGVAPWFAYTVGLLLLVVVAALTGLSLRLYTRARAADAHANSVQSRLDQQQQALSMLGEHLTELGVRLKRGSLPARTVRLDGREVTLLEASAGQGEQIGLQPGDLLYVKEQPATASSPATPTTAPAIPWVGQPSTSPTTSPAAPKEP